MKRDYLDVFNLTRISDMARENLECWLLEELQNLYQDFGQKFDIDQIKYEANRLKEIVTGGKYKGWHCGDVHTALQSMMGDSKYFKLSIRTILSALERAWEIRANENRIKGNSSTYIETVDRAECAKAADYWAPYINWWMVNKVDPSLVSVDMYNEAKEKGNLNDLTMMWSGSREPGSISKILTHV